MAKILKILGNTILILIEFLLITVIALFFLARTSSFQTFLAQKATGYLRETLDTDIGIAKVDIAFLDRISLKEVYVADQKKDTLFFIDDLFVNYQLNRDFLDLNFHLDKVNLRNAKAYLKRYEGEKELNMQFFIDVFKKETPSEKEVDFTLSVARLEVENTNFIFHDENKKALDFGVDFSYLDLKEINIIADDVLVLVDDYRADFKKIAFKDRSGFEVNNFESLAHFNLQTGLELGNTEISSTHSVIKMKEFVMLTHSLDDYRAFVDKVELNSEFDTSFVSLTDVSYFAPQLKGMNEIIVMSGKSNHTVQDLALTDMRLKFGRGSVIHGDFYLPDFRQLSSENINQQLDYIFMNVADLTSLRLPESASMSFIPWPKALKELTYFEGTNVSLQGSLNHLNTHVSKLNTNIGSLQFNDDFTIHADTTFNNFVIHPKNGVKDVIKIQDLSLRKLLLDKNFGSLNGYLGLDEIAINKQGIKAKNIKGLVENTELYGYKYEYLILDGVNYTLNKTGVKTQNEALGNIYIRDENFDLTFKGFVSIGAFLEMKADLAIECAMLDHLHPALKNRGELISSVNVNAKGKDFNDFKGNIIIDTLYYEEDGNSFATNDFNGFVERNKSKDSISIKSDIIDAEVNGLIDYAVVFDNIQDQIGKVFPALNLSNREEVKDERTFFDYDITFKHINDVLVIFYPEVKISDKANVYGKYVGEANNIGLNIFADYFTYKQFNFSGISAMQDVSRQELLALIDINTFAYKDSVTYQNIHFTGLAANGKLDSQLLFDDTEDKRSNLEWFTDLKESGTFDIDIFPSYLIFNGKRWDVNQIASVNYSDSCFTFENLKLQHYSQYISAQGNLSNNNEDKLFLDVMDLDLGELSEVFTWDTKFKGRANVSGFITNPSNLQFIGDAVVEDFFVNDSEVGVVGLGVSYNSSSDRLKMHGDIFYKNAQTFMFDGYYVVKDDTEEKGSINYDMIFKKTDIGVVNEFLDPDFIKDLKAKLNGNLKLTGTFNNPVLTGKLNIDDGLLNLAILGADMYFNGEVEVLEDGIFIDQMPLKDVEGNTGSITGTLIHDNFKDMYFDLVINLENHPTKRLPDDPSKLVPVDRFMVMNTTYNVDSPYYGDAYVTGLATVAGYLDDLSIVVNAKTRRGTKFVLPLYGPTTIEEDGFIKFKRPESEENRESKIDLTGLNLELNIEATDDAEVKIIFDDKVGDELTARGKGNVRLSVDQFNELAMDGVYTVSKGSYNFVLGPYSQTFNIAPGGTVQWVGDPFAAILDINAYNKTMANLSVVMPDVVDNKSSNNEEIYYYLSITESLNDPEISFDIDAPKASESGKAIISRIRSDKDELNRQFFSLVISKSLMPLSGMLSASGSSGAFLDLASTQINNILNRMADGYSMNVNLENDDLTGQFSGEFGLSKSFLDDRLFISGSFGVGTRKGEGGVEEGENVPNQNTFIGDVRIEYLLNEEGTFRMNVFNESNNNYILQNEGRGQFTQGIGVSYKEDFNNLGDFKLMQFFANLFRKKENKVDIGSKRKRKEPIPVEYLHNKNSILEENE